MDGSPRLDFPGTPGPVRGTGAQPIAADRLPGRRRRVSPRVNLALFLATVLATLIAGAILAHGGGLTWETVRTVALSPRLWTAGLPYSLCVILILGCHEMGHYLACRYYGIEATLPFFLPGPPPFGTFGAVIRIRSPFIDRRALFDVGVAGPIAGFVAAIPILVYGLGHSTVTREPPQSGDLFLASCLLLNLLYPMFFEAWPDVAIRLHPTVAAAWLGLFATALNLLPVGQLDGGHMLYAVSRRAHALVSRAGIVLLILGGFFIGGSHLVMFGAMFALLGPGHPPTLDEARGLGPGRVAVALLGVGIFLLCFIPFQPIDIYLEPSPTSLLALNG
ncbi:MAG: site-2 protease family protein [Acidobacteriota bacterium]